MGKSSTAKTLLSMVVNSAYIDADCCRAINPFQFTIETKKTVTENIYCLIHNYLKCIDIKTMIFPYSFHGERKEIWDNVVKKLHEQNLEFEICSVILKCSREENIRRARRDNRDESRIKRGMLNTYDFYDDKKYPVIDTTNMNESEVAEKIVNLCKLEVKMKKIGLGMNWDKRNGSL